MQVTHERGLSEKDKQAVSQLLAENFPGQYEQLIDRFSSEISRKNDAHYLIARDDHKIVGVLMLLDKVMNYLGTPLNVLGMSYMAIDKNHQNSSIADTFKSMVLAIGNDYDLSLGFARKKMDGYWSPYQFVGISNFSEFLINVYDITVFDPDASVSIEPAKVSDISHILDCQKWENHLLVGNIKRSENDIEFLMNDPNLRVTIKVIKRGQDNIGFMIHSSENVIEIKVKEDFFEETAFAVKKHFRKLDKENIFFSQHLNAPFLKYLKRFSHQQKKRYVFEGGHIVRISDIKMFFKKITPALQKRMQLQKLKDFAYSNDLMSMEMVDGNLNIVIEESASQKHLTMITFGIVPFADIFLNTIFGQLNTKFNILDEF